MRIQFEMGSATVPVAVRRVSRRTLRGARDQMEKIVRRRHATVERDVRQSARDARAPLFHCALQTHCQLNDLTI